MKYLFVMLSSLLLLQLTLWGTTPYNLEGIKALNVLVQDENDVLSADFEARLKALIRGHLERNGIAAKKDGVGAMFVNLTALDVGKTTVIKITLGIGEETLVLRDKEIESFALTYSYSDMIKTQHVEADVYDSVNDYLIDEFLEQFHEDNEQ